MIAAAIAVTWLHDQFYGGATTDRFVLSVSNEDVTGGNWSVIEQCILENIDHDWAFKLYAERLNLSGSLKAGSYLFEPNQSVIRIVRMLKLGEQQSVDVTFNNLRTLPEFAGRISEQLDVDSLMLLDYLRREDIASKYGFTPETIFSMFIPNTYKLYWSTTPEKFVERMHAEHNKFWNSDRQAKAAALKLSRTEVMTLASIVYEETKRTSEMSRVAGVYTNRLKRGIPLQADPTVKYALQDFTIKRVLNKHLKYDSPYNTYKYKGLPPAPIAMPSIAAIDASLSPEQHSYIFFCARPTFDGYHNFAVTLKEHNENAAAYINELNRLKIK